MRQAYKVKVVALDIETAHAPTWAVEKEAEILISKVKRRKEKIFKTEAKQEEEKKSVEREYVEKCEEKRQEAFDKSALSNNAQVACIGIVADEFQYHFSTFVFSDDELIDLLSQGIIPLTFDSIREMLEGFAWWTQTYCDLDTKYVGHNAWHFDYPKLRLAYIREGLKVPFALSKENKWNCHDSMEIFKFFSGSIYTSLEEMCLALEIPFVKTMSGADVPEAIERKEYLRVTLYNMPDAWACYLAFLKMRGF